MHLQTNFCISFAYMQSLYTPKPAIIVQHAVITLYFNADQRKLMSTSTRTGTGGEWENGKENLQGFDLRTYHCGMDAPVCENVSSVTCISWMCMEQLICIISDISVMRICVSVTSQPSARLHFWQLRDNLSPKSQTFLFISRIWVSVPSVPRQINSKLGEICIVGQKLLRLHSLKIFWSQRNVTREREIEMEKERRRGIQG